MFKARGERLNRDQGEVVVASAIMTFKRHFDRKMNNKGFE